MRTQRRHNPDGLRRIVEGLATAEAFQAAPETIEGYRTLATDLFARMSADCGKDIARKIWADVTKRGRGFSKSDAQAREDAIIWILDAGNRELLGMTAEESAEKLHDTRGFCDTPEAALRKLNRMRKRAYADSTPPTREQWEAALTSERTSIRE